MTGGLCALHVAAQGEGIRTATGARGGHGAPGSLVRPLASAGHQRYPCVPGYRRGRGVPGTLRHLVACRLCSRPLVSSCLCGPVAGTWGHWCVCGGGGVCEHVCTRMHPLLRPPVSNIACYSCVCALCDTPPPLHACMVARAVHSLRASLRASCARPCCRCSKIPRHPSRPPPCRCGQPRACRPPRHRSPPAWRRRSRFRMHGCPLACSCNDWACSWKARCGRGRDCELPADAPMHAQ